MGFGILGFWGFGSWLWGSEVLVLWSFAIVGLGFRGLGLRILRSLAQTRASRGRLIVAKALLGAFVVYRP